MRARRHVAVVHRSRSARDPTGGNDVTLDAADAPLLFAAVASVADALYVVDPTGHIRYLNPAALTILGYEDESALLGRSSHDTIHYLRPNGTLFPSEECPLLLPLATGETIRVEDDWFVRSDGSLVPVAYSSAPVALLDGRGAVVSFRDTSARRRFERALRQRDVERARAVQLEASRARIVAAGDEARRRIERDLHDGVQQQLIQLGLQLEALRHSVPPERGKHSLDLDRLADGIRTLVETVNEISRGVHPAILTEAGFAPALRALCRRSVIPLKVQLDVPGRLPESIEIATYYVVSEALTNAAKHANASVVAIAVKASSGRLRITIRDDGVGSADATRGSGLTGLADRVEALNGGFAFESPPGEGTTISVEFPLTAKAASAGP